jgi:hypothetical protein
MAIGWFAAADSVGSFSTVPHPEQKDASTTMGKMREGMVII